ncbi:MATE family efflux transporter [Butyrivibrio sp. INlla16]|uniref:MATE family efflux transporter n=1 Tax=Butyrivibrio sp. INlla16 TaxID=1520807 RepID=UPI0008855293|nr:MATE family efflux transporter [Butyrivibrio sp. INlla16]SDB17475.1 putative efflux protein, MATE family [Butyrivibrio sp. INlla16]
MQQNRYEMMTTTPVPKLILKMAVPTIISMLVTGIYNTADTFFVGKISTQATAAVGIVFTVMALVQATGFFCGHGSGNFLSRMLGAGKTKEANEMASTGFAIAIILGIIIAIVGNIFVDDIAMMIGSTPTTLEDTRKYMRIILIGAPFMTGQFVINNQLRFQGSAVYAMVGLMCGAAMNMVLDPLLIFVFNMGVTGAAVATIMGQITSFIVLLVGSSKGENIRLSFKNIHINSYYIKEITNGGAPSLFRQALAAIASMLMNKAAGTFGGDAAIAGMSVNTRVMMMMSSALIGFGQGYQPVCSFNYGAGLKKRVKEGYFFCVKYSTIFLCIVGAVCFYFAPQIIAVFRDDPEVIAVGSVALKWTSATIPLSGCIVMTNMMLQFIGRGVKASIMASCRNGIFFIPMILLLPQLFGLFGVEITQAVADIFSILVSIPMAYSEIRHFKA